MRTFEQYIDEAYSFRLGGSQNKGYGQAAVENPFEDLKPGDVVYWWTSWFPHKIKKIEFKRWYNDSHRIVSENGSLYALRGIDKKKNVWTYSSHVDKKTCSTSLEELIKAVKEEFNVTLEKYSLRKE